MAIERIVPGTKEWDYYYANHICRYKFAKSKLVQFTPGKILDIACGVGYGTKYLSSIKDVQLFGFDKSDDALEIANKYFKSENLIFQNDDCDTFLNAKKNHPYDSIVSFETLEHLKNPKLFLANCFENLKSCGQLIISTPNSKVTSPDGIIDSMFHEIEYSAIEFRDLLEKSGFTNITLYGQQYSDIGKLKLQLASYINAINQNPLVRLGRWIQENIRRKNVKHIFLEEVEDWEIVKIENLDEIDKLKKEGPQVIIATAFKPLAL